MPARTIQSHPDKGWIRCSHPYPTPWPGFLSCCFGSLARARHASTCQLDYPYKLDDNKPAHPHIHQSHFTKFTSYNSHEITRKHKTELLNQMLLGETMQGFFQITEPDGSRLREKHKVLGALKRSFLSRGISGFSICGSKTATLKLLRLHHDLSSTWSLQTNYFQLWEPGGLCLTLCMKMMALICTGYHL
jgi:hypothetical protein